MSLTITPGTPTEFRDQVNREVTLGVRLANEYKIEKQ